MDLMNIPFADAAFDLVLCSHVLEHVADDHRAMREIRRILTERGHAVLLVPITRARTLEDASITDPAERARVFGQHDHVRAYGPDFADRLRAAGFAVRAVGAGDVGTPDEIETMRLGGTLYACEGTPLPDVSR
jgi:SAM-dependent methyltransferase